MIQATSVFDQSRHEKETTPERRNPNIDFYTRFEGLLGRLSQPSTNVLEADVAKLLNSVSGLLKAADPFGLRPASGDCLSILRVVDDFLVTKVPQYASLPAGPERTRVQFKESVELLRDCGLISNETNAFFQSLSSSTAFEEPQTVSSLRAVVLADVREKFIEAIAGHPMADYFSQTCERLVSVDAADLLRVLTPLCHVEQVNGDVRIALTKDVAGMEQGGKLATAKFRFENANLGDKVFLKRLYQTFVDHQTASSSSIVETPLFSKLAAQAKLEELTGVSVSRALIVEDLVPNALIKDVHVADCAVKLCGSVILQDVTLKNCRILFKDCENSSLQNVSIDKASSLAGVLDGSRVDARCELHGYAATLSLRNIQWGTGTTAKPLHERVSDLTFHTNHVDKTFRELLGKKYKVLGPVEMKALRIEHNKAYDAQRAAEELKRTGLTVSSLDLSSSGAILPNGLAAADAEAFEVRGIFLGKTGRWLKHEAVIAPGNRATEAYGSFVYDPELTTVPMERFDGARHVTATIAEAVLAVLDDADFSALVQQVYRTSERTFALTKQLPPLPRKRHPFPDDVDNLSGLARV